jgi:PPOX class probable F420-dependent enzyme
MDIEAALRFVRENDRAVVATRRRDDRPQMSPVNCGVDAENRIVISSRETAMKVKNLRRDPRVSVCVFTDTFFGQWAQVDGTAEIVSLPEAMEPLVEYYRTLAGEHPNWEDYRNAMQRDGRCLIRITVTDAGPAVSG